MSTCYLCNAVLTTDNSSIEHIILNSIGGRLKSQELLCKKCNSLLGESSDKELSNQLSLFAGLFQVKRERGEHPPIKGGTTQSGKEYIINDGYFPILSKPIVEIQENDNRVDIHIVARNKNELKKILQGIQNKYPSKNLNIDEVVKNAEETKRYLDEPISYSKSIGGDIAFHSIAKTAINFYILKSGDRDQVKHLFKYLKNEEKIKIVTHFYPSQPIYKKEAKEIVHLIHLHGDKYSKILYCYIEFFSTYSFLVKLSDDYSGKSISETYCYNLTDNKKCAKVVKLKLSPKDFKIDRKLDSQCFAKIKENADRFMKIVSEKNFKRVTSELTSKAINKIFDKYKHEPIITQQMINELSLEIATAYTKFICRYNSHDKSGTV